MIAFVLTALAAPPPDPELDRDAMDAHWDASGTLRHALVRGSLEQVRATAAAWRQVPADASSPVSVEAKRRLDPVLAALATAGSVAEAGNQVGRMAAVCGGCHGEHGKTRSWEPPDPPHTGIMERHRAGADYLWAGLVSGNAVLFDVGLKTFVFPTDSEPLAAHLEAQVVALRSTEGLEPRSEAYGAILTTCATCHQAARTLPTTGVLLDQMHDRFRALTDARTAILAGDGQGWRAQAELLAELEVPAEPVEGPWRPWMAELRELAGNLAVERDRSRAAIQLANLAEHCGSCHASAGAGPAAPRRDTLTDATTGVDVLWMAMITGDDEAWSLGASMVDTPGLKKVVGDARPAAFAAQLLGPPSKRK